jgi:signal transduction histidine kinase
VDTLFAEIDPALDQVRKAPEALPLAGPGGALRARADRPIERMRQEWTTLVLHELRQPLSSIAVSIEPLAQAAVTVAQARAAQRIRRATQAMARIVSDLLDLSLLDGDHLALETTRLPLAGWLEDVLERLGQSLARRFVLEAPVAMAAVLADPGRLEQILANLLSNAAKYGAEGKDIRLSLEPRGPMVAIAVTNEGPGLTPAELARLFSRYYRTEGARRVRGGLGLGLYITKGLVEAHGGQIEVESTPGKTTTFRFTLPCVTEP